MCYRTFPIKLWVVIAKTLTKYITDSKKIADEDDRNGHYFKTVKLVLSFPFQYTFLENVQQVYVYIYIILCIEKYFLLPYIYST